MSLPRLSLFDSDPAESAVDAVVIGVHSRDRAGDLLVASGAESITAAFDGQLTDALRVLGATGDAGEVVKLATLGTIAAPLVVAVGLGRCRPAPAATWRCCAAARVPRSRAAGRRQGGAGAARARRRHGAAGGAGGRGGRPARAPTGSPATRAASPDRPRSVARGARRRSPRPSADGPRCGAPAPSPRRSARTRDWVNTAPNLLRPPDFADQVARGRDRGRSGGGGARRAGAAPGRIRRHPRRRPGVGGSAAAGRRSTPGPPAGGGPRRAGRQGHHLRHRRRLDQARAGHVGDDSPTCPAPPRSPPP